MKILHISGARSWGGNEQQMIDFIPELQKLGVDNSVLGVAGSPLQQQCIEKGIVFIGAKKEKLNKFANYGYLKQLVKELRPDVLHLHTSDSLTVFTIADLLYRLKVKAVFSKKGMGSSSSLLSKFKYNYKNVAYSICVSQKVQQDFSKILSSKNKGKAVVVHDCVAPAVLDAKITVDDLRQKLAIPQEKLIVGNIANHTAAKDLATLINTADHLVNTMGVKDVVFVQIGAFSKLTPLLKETVKEKQLEDTVIFTDKIANASQYGPQFDIFLMTSEREGGPTSVLEAMYLEVPVVSTNVGVINEVIKDGINGFVAPVKDHKALAEKTNTLLRDKALQQVFTAKSKAIITEGFTVETLAPQLLQIYKLAI